MSSRPGKQGDNREGPRTQCGAAAGGTGWLARAKLVEEVTHYPDWPTNEGVMAQWFGEFWLPKMTPSPALPPPEAAELDAGDRHVRLGSALAQVRLDDDSSNSTAGLVPQRAPLGR
jgi:hypothetical protein